MHVETTEFIALHFTRALLARSARRAPVVNNEWTFYCRQRARISRVRHFLRFHCVRPPPPVRSLARSLARVHRVTFLPRKKNALWFIVCSMGARVWPESPVNEPVGERIANLMYYIKSLTTLRENLRFLSRRKSSLVPSSNINKNHYLNLHRFELSSNNVNFF